MCVPEILHFEATRQKHMLSALKAGDFVYMANS